MKAICIKQPFASLVLHGKTWEVRSQRSHYRGPLLIVATAEPFSHEETAKMIPWRLQKRSRTIAKPEGVTVAVVDMVDCIAIDDCGLSRDEIEDRTFTTADYHRGKWAWVFENPRAVEEFPFQGFQGWRPLKEFEYRLYTQPPTATFVGGRSLKVIVGGCPRIVDLPINQTCEMLQEFDELPPLLLFTMSQVMAAHAGRGAMARRLKAPVIESLKGGYCSFFGVDWETITAKKKMRYNVTMRRKITGELHRRGYSVEEIGMHFLDGRSSSLVNHYLRTHDECLAVDAYAVSFRLLCTHVDTIMLPAPGSPSASAELDGLGVVG